MSSTGRRMGRYCPGLGSSRGPKQQKKKKKAPNKRDPRVLPSETYFLKKKTFSDSLSVPFVRVSFTRVNPALRASSRRSPPSSSNI